MQTIEQKAEKAYNAYNETSEKPWLTWNGLPVPRWHELPATESGRIVQRKWVAAVTALQGPGVTVQAKVSVGRHEINKYPGGFENTTVCMSPVNGPGNESWASASPGGRFDLVVANKAALELLKPGQTFILDFRPVES